MVGAPRSSKRSSECRHHTSASSLLRRSCRSAEFGACRRVRCRPSCHPRSFPLLPVRVPSGPVRVTLTPAAPRARGHAPQQARSQRPAPGVRPANSSRLITRPNESQRIETNSCNIHHFIYILHSVCERFEVFVCLCFCYFLLPFFFTTPRLPAALGAQRPLAAVTRAAVPGRSLSFSQTTSILILTHPFPMPMNSPFVLLFSSHSDRCGRATL